MPGVPEVCAKATLRASGDHVGVMRVSEVDVIASAVPPSEETM